MWVRCVKGSATVALVVSSLPETARIQDADELEVTLDYYDALLNVSLGSGGAKNVLRCQLAAPSSSDASETFSKWTQLEVAVRSSKPEHEVVVQVVVQSEDSPSAILVDDASLEAGAYTRPLF